MQRSGQHPERVAENFLFVFFAYFLAIAAWYAASGDVFISSRWRTVSKTRKRGQRNLLVLFFGMSYLVVYAYFQAKSGDFKEVCLTLVAFVAVMWHMLRTVLGLWQLHVFKHWVVRSIRSMESLGYRIELSDAENGKNMLRARFSEAAEEQAERRAHFDADNMIANDTTVCSRMSEGDAQCELQFFTPKQKQDLFCTDSFLMRVLLTLFYSLNNIICLGGIAWSLWSGSPLLSNPDSIPFLRLREPEEVWLRWATVLMSCAFPHWLTDTRKSRSEEPRSQVLEYQAYRDRFAEAVLRSAALHCEGHTTKTSHGSLRPFHLWQNFPKLSGGIFCKQEFLKHACTSGKGLPFQEPHKCAASRVEEDLVYSYAKYRSKLEEARDALPANQGEKLACLGIEELEWLSILLSVEDWSIGTVEEGKDPENLSRSQPPNYDSCDIAIENLCNQLGFPGNLKGFSERFATPFLKGKEGTTLWGNRNVLTLSAHVDNWLALLAGEQVTYMVQQKPGREEVFPLRNLDAKESQNWAQQPVGVTEDILEERIHLEKQRLMVQLSVADAEFSHLEQSLTFLGCSMENLRSNMAKWVESNPEDQTGAWAPTLGSSGVSIAAMNGGKFEFHASKDFELCLSKVSSVCYLSQRYLQMRLLWELQNNLHNSLSGCGISPNQTEAILLCILSFPAIRVIASEIEQAPESTVSVQRNRNYCCIKIGEKPPTFRIEDCKLTLWASHGPQNVHIEVLFTRQVTGIAVTAQLCGNEFEEGKPFVWEAWRDVFHRSLQSMRQWQVEHQIGNSSLSVRPCIGGIGEGICEIETVTSGIGPTMKVWKGWPPHRETLSKYEMMTDGLFLEGKKTAMVPAKVRFAHGKGSHFVERPRIQYVPVIYEEAEGQYFACASLIAQDFLREATCCSVDGTAGESSKAHRNLKMLRYEIWAIIADDDNALDKTMNMLILRNPNPEAIEIAVELLEVYCTFEAAKAPSIRILESLSRPVRKENWVQKIKGHYEVLMSATRFDPIVAKSFAAFCSAVPFYRKELLIEDGVRALATAIVRTTYSGNVLLAFELTKSLETLVGSRNEELFSLACSMLLNKIERACKILSKTRNDNAMANANHLRKGCKPFFKTFENSCGEESVPLLPDFKSELEKRKSDAQERLRQLFIKPKPCRSKTFATRARKLYSQAADDGDLVSAYHLGFLLEHGTRPNPSRARKLYTQAMNAGIDAAAGLLAVLYACGDGVTRNVPYAVQLYTQAIDGSGDIRAMYRLAGLLEEGAEGVPADPPRAVQLLSRAVEEEGDVDSMQYLAYILESGAEGVPEDAPYAVHLYECAIMERGDYQAKNNLAQLLESGAVGVPINLKRAITLYESAVDEDGNTKAMTKLGHLYLKGKGVPADAVHATQLFHRAIEKDGNALALVYLADVLMEGAIGVPQDPIRAVELYTRAIEEHGSGDAMYELASVLEFGKNGVRSDSARAFSLYNRAASEKKHRGAARRLRKVEKQKQVLEQVKHIWSK